MRKTISFLGVAVMVLLAGCSSSGTTHGATTGRPTSTATSSSTPSQRDASTTVWLCRPGSTDDPCTMDSTVTEISADGARSVTRSQPSTNPKIDCFYVYPTVSAQKTAVADLGIDPEEIAVAKAQASRFSSVCRVFAPMYRQRTIAGIFGAKATAAESAYAFDDVKAAWDDYLAHDNDGRGVILLGHSQGSFVLTRLIADVIEKDPATLKLLVSAILLGGNVTVPDGADVGGSFTKVPVCRHDTQTGCVIAYSTFSDTPVEAAMFGRAGNGTRVVCTNPASLGGGSAKLHPTFVTGESLLGSIDTVGTKVDTPWVGYPDRYTGECRSDATHDWLQVTAKPASSAEAEPTLVEPLGPTWGLHLVDVNIAMGDLVTLAADQADAWDGR